MIQTYTDSFKVGVEDGLKSKEAAYEAIPFERGTAVFEDRRVQYSMRCLHDGKLVPKALPGDHFSKEDFARGHLEGRRLAKCLQG